MFAPIDDDAPKPVPVREWLKAFAIAAAWAAGMKATEKLVEWGVDALKERASKSKPVARKEEEPKRP